MCSEMNGKKFVKDERIHVPQLLHIDSDTINVRLFPHYYEEANAVDTTQVLLAKVNLIKMGKDS